MPVDENRSPHEKTEQATSLNGSQRHTHPYKTRGHAIVAFFISALGKTLYFFLWSEILFLGSDPTTLQPMWNLHWQVDNTSGGETNSPATNFPISSGQQRLHHSHLPQVPWFQILMQGNCVSNINELSSCTRFLLI